MNSYQGKWEQRWHPLRREWVVYSAHRQFRPWSGLSSAAPESAVEYDPQCYLCPGNARIHGDRNPPYRDLFVFDNDHPVVGPDAPEILIDPPPLYPQLYRREPAKGAARVLCYDPRHHVSLAQLPLANGIRVFQAWKEQTLECSQKPHVRFVLIFENRGELVGTSNPHPHCQIYATTFPFHWIEQELEAMELYHRETGRNIFHDILESERKDGRRIIAENRHALAFVPFFARYAYEVYLFPASPHATLLTMEEEELAGLAEVYLQVIRRYDLLFDMPFPFVMAIYQAPVDGRSYAGYHLHLVVQPPLRQPGLQKFLAGPEIGGGNFMADTMPEDKALELRSIDLSQFKEIGSSHA